MGIFYGRLNGNILRKTQLEYSTEDSMGIFYGKLSWNILRKTQLEYSTEDKIGKLARKAVKTRRLDSGKEGDCC